MIEHMSPSREDDNHVPAGRQSMPGGLVDGCGVRLAGAASYFPCAAWLWPEQAAEEAQPILQPPTQNLAEALIPPSQPGIHQNGGQLFPSEIPQPMA